MVFGLCRLFVVPLAESGAVILEISDNNIGKSVGLESETTESVIRVQNLKHSYGSLSVLQGISFTAYRGQVFGLLGANGAGKTTTVRILCGQMAYESGLVDVLGCDPCRDGGKLRPLIGVMSENPGHYERLSVLANLVFFARIFQCEEPKSRALELLKLVGLEDKQNEPVSHLSKGMHQRLALARALIGRPQLLFLDEPTSGLDPTAAVKVHQLIDKFCVDGGSVFLTTHYLREAEELCAQVAILNDGRIACCGNPLELCAKYLPPEVERKRGGRWVHQAPGLEELFQYFTDRSIGQE